VLFGGKKIQGSPAMWRAAYGNILLNSPTLFWRRCYTCCRSGSVIGSGAFLTPGSGIQILDPEKHPGSATLSSISKICPMRIEVDAHRDDWLNWQGSLLVVASVGIRVFLGLPIPDPDQLVRGTDTDPDPAPDPDPSLLDGLKICLKNKILTQNFSKKLNY